MKSKAEWNRQQSWGWQGRCRLWPDYRSINRNTAGTASSTKEPCAVWEACSSGWSFLLDRGSSLRSHALMVTRTDEFLGESHSLEGICLLFASCLPFAGIFWLGTIEIDIVIFLAKALFIGPDVSDSGKWAVGKVWGCQALVSRGMQSLSLRHRVTTLATGVTLVRG